MPSYLEYGNQPRQNDTIIDSLQKINDLLYQNTSGGITAGGSVGSPAALAAGGATDWGTGAVQTSASGGTFVTLSSNNAREVTIVNNSGTDLVFQKSGATQTPCTIVSATAFTISLQANTNEVQVRRSDSSNTQVTVSFYYKN